MRLSCGRMIRLYAHTPFPPFRQQHVSLSQSSCVSPGQAYCRWTGGRRWAWSRIIRPQESLPLYKLFNTLWCRVSGQETRGQETRETRGQETRETRGQETRETRGQETRETRGQETREQEKEGKRMVETMPKVSWQRKVSKLSDVCLS